MAVGDTRFESDGKAVNVTLTAAVVKGQVAVVEGWLGIAGENGAIGETIALICDDREYQFLVPAALGVVKGDTVFVTIATVTGHTPQDAAYTVAAGAGKLALFKATAAKSASNMVTGIMLAHNALAS
jgi:hypothetical protein